MPYKLHKTVVDDYGVIFLKWLETVVTNHGFNFKFKTVVGDYGFDFFFKWSKPLSPTAVLTLYIILIFLIKILYYFDFKYTYFIILKIIIYEIK